MEVKVKRLADNAIMPTKSQWDDAGFDLYSTEELTIYAGDTVLVSTGISMEIPTGHVGLIWPRSGLASKHGIDVFAGVIDAGYRGEIKVCLHNGKLDIFNEWKDGMGMCYYTDYQAWQDNLKTIDKGDKIAQILIQPVPDVTLTEVDSLSESTRGGKGFGSSGR